MPNIITVHNYSKGNRLLACLKCSKYKFVSLKLSVMRFPKLRSEEVKRWGIFSICVQVQDCPVYIYDDVMEEEMLKLSIKRAVGKG